MSLHDEIHQQLLIYKWISTETEQWRKRTFHQGYQIIIGLNI